MAFLNFTFLPDAVELAPEPRNLRRLRGRLGLANTHLQHVPTAAAMNVVRLAAWLGGTPLARTRQSAFVRLMAQPACT